MTRVVVISNPVASRSGPGALSSAVEALRKGGLTVDVAPTREAGHGAELARAALDDGAEMIVAHGGDGTIMDIANTMVGTGVPLGILPAGTGNRLADNLGIRWAPREASSIILAGHTRPVDVGRLQSGARTHYFAVAAGCGFDADVMQRTTYDSKRMLGSFAYVVTALRLAMDLPRANVRIDVDGVVHETEAVSVLLANSGEILPTGRPFARHISLDDGVLDVIVLQAFSFAGAAYVAGRLATGRTAGGSGISFLRGRCIRITSDPSMPAQADGEACGGTPLTAEVVPGGLTVLAPPAA